MRIFLYQTLHICIADTVLQVLYAEQQFILRILKSEISFQILKEKGICATQRLYHRDARAFFLWVRGVDPAMKLPFAGENPLKGADCNCGKS